MVEEAPARLEEGQSQCFSIPPPLEKQMSFMELPQRTRDQGVTLAPGTYSDLWVQERSAHPTLRSPAWLASAYDSR